MEILNKNTALVETSEELKSTLEENNEITYIYLKNDITLTYSKEKGSLLNLNDNPLEINEEYFANIYFTIEE